MDGSAASVQFYATKLIGLDKSQQAAAMSALRLTTEQKKQITTMSALIVSAQRYTIQELAEKASTDKATASALAKNMAKATEKRTTEQLSAAMMVEILNSNKLTATQKHPSPRILPHSTPKNPMNSPKLSLSMPKAAEKLPISANIELKSAICVSISG